jgi:ABC-2 type transport system permease protein
MRNTWLFCQKELRSFFNSPVAYIVLSIFIFITGFFFTSSLFLMGQASMRPLFSLVPVVFLFFVPAITMRLLAEEKRSGSIELLVTLPTRDWEIVIGKFLAAWILILSALALTLIFTFTVAMLGDLDGGETTAGYLGLVLMGGAFAAIGTWSSSLTRNQIIAFIIALALIAALSMIDDLLPVLPLSLAPVLQFLSVSYHFENISRGVLDTRDLLFYFSLIFFMLFLAHNTLESRKWK